jgi:flavin reductase (DIM6/NTAB) family NADH-FMN oxidoreductase RutF
MDYSPAQGHGLSRDPFKSITSPRPIAWISTVSRDGIANLAPYSQWQNMTWDPPLVLFAANQRETGGRKDSVLNAEDTGWFVFNTATWDLREEMVYSSRNVPAYVDEFELAGVEKEDSAIAPCPRVKESPCHLECRYLQTLRIPAATEVASVDLVIGRVEHVHIADEVILPDGKLDVFKIRPIARLGYNDYTVVESSFEMIARGATVEELAGMEGTSG